MEQDIRVIEGFIGSCECGFETSDCYTKSQVRDEMAAHFVAVGEEHDYERIG
jgi:hypothetical protein